MITSRSQDETRAMIRRAPRPQDTLKKLGSAALTRDGGTLLDEAFEGAAGYEKPSAQPDAGQLSPVEQFVRERPGDTEDLRGFLDGEHQLVFVHYDHPIASASLSDLGPTR